MDTLVRTPQDVFTQPQRLVVPLFQRPYVWNQENQWEPLWNDVVRVAERIRRNPGDRVHPHFLGAVVLQQAQNPVGLMQERTIIDGQQRLTTLQLLLDALHAELLFAGVTSSAMRIEPLVKNAEAFCTNPEDRFKVWPTNRDRAAFNAVMAAEPPVDHDAVGHSGERMVEAHRYFSEQARQWLSGADQPETVAAAVIETAVRECLQMVVIDLGPDENAQEIFETLNARGAQLTAADLIKNFIFQKLLESGADVEEAYERNWKEFETAFWEKEISVGRIRYPRSSIFVNHWLVARTGDEVVAREVFQRFKGFALDSGSTMGELLDQLQRAASVYRQFVSDASMLTGPMDRLGLFGYRTGVLQSEVIKPLVLYLLDPEQPPIPEGQIIKALDVVESWMVRRMLVRATTKAYNLVVAELLSRLREGDRNKAGDEVQSFFVSQKGNSRYWPDNDELRTELRTLPAYRRLGRGRLRMVLESIEDHLRGWKGGEAGLGGERIARAKNAIEHVMPRKWATHWPPSEGFRGETDRERLVHTIGNLTLLPTKLNSKASNAAWRGTGGKWETLERHDVFMLNRSLLGVAGDSWTDDAIRSRSDELVQWILEIWPVPSGYRSGFAAERPRPRQRIHLVDLIYAGLLEPGVQLVPRPKKLARRVATLLQDGQIDVDGKTFDKPSAAAAAIAGKRRDGMWFFLVEGKRSLRDVWREYVDALAVDVADEDSENGDEE